MKTVAIAMQKGGVGKSTLTRSLAVAGTAAGYNVLALDMDAQQSTAQWAERRKTCSSLSFASRPRSSYRNSSSRRNKPDATSRDHRLIAARAEQ